MQWPRTQEETDTEELDIDECQSKFIEFIDHLIELQNSITNIELLNGVQNRTKKATIDHI